MRRQQLTEAQITALLDPPTDQRELVRHYTLTAADLAAIRRCRGDHNRLGHALMLCYLRYPGRPLKARERPPRPLLLFIADQIDALPGSIEDYLAAGRNRQRHVAELQDRPRHAIGQMNKRREPVELEVIALLDHRALLVERVPGTGIALGFAASGIWRSQASQLWLVSARCCVSASSRRRWSAESPSVSRR